MKDAKDAKPATYLIPLNFHQKLQFFELTARGIAEGIIAAAIVVGVIMLFSFLAFWLRLGLMFILGGGAFIVVARGFYGEPFSKFLVTYVSHKKQHKIYELRRVYFNGKQKK